MQRLCSANFNYTFIYLKPIFASLSPPVRFQHERRKDNLHSELTGKRSYFLQPNKYNTNKQYKEEKKYISTRISQNNTFA